jgi:hypothetical protein
MRCPNCNKFVPLELQEPEVNGDPELSYSNGDDSVTVSLEDVRIVRTCEECGEELKEATLSLEGVVEVPVEHTAHDGKHSLEATADVEGTERTDGKPGTPGRYRRSFFGAKADVEIRCSCQDAKAEPLATLEIEDEVQASSMDEMV